MNLNEYQGLFVCKLSSYLAITLQSTSEKYEFLYLCSQQLSKFHFPKFESRRSLGRKILFVHSLQIEIDFHPTNIRIKLQSSTPCNIPTELHLIQWVFLKPGWGFFDVDGAL